MTIANEEFLAAKERRNRSSVDTLGELLTDLDSCYVFRDRADLARLVNWSDGKDAPFHRWFRYREAFSPDLISHLRLGNRILDPFSGCGSTLVGAMQTDRTAVGIDLNPLATFVSKVKATPLASDEKVAVERFVADLELFGPEEVGQTPLPDLSIADKVFEPVIAQTLLSLRSRILDANISETARDFLQVGWLGILEKVGSYFKEGNGIKYRRMQRRPGKYVIREEGAWQLARFGSDQAKYVLNRFREHVSLMIDDADYWSAMKGTAKAINGNALDLGKLTAGKFDDIVFSPPYANRFDYFESMKVELWFGGFVSSYDQMKHLRKASLRSHLASDMSRHTTSFPELEILIDTMDQRASSWRMGVPDLLRGYFSDIVDVLKQCRQRLGDGACYVVVGNSAFAGTIIPSDVLTAIAGEKAGFTNSEIWVTRHLTVAPQQRSRLTGLEHFMRESIVVLKP